MASREILIPVEPSSIWWVASLPIGTDPVVPVLAPLVPTDAVVPVPAPVVPTDPVVSVPAAVVPPAPPLPAPESPQPRNAPPAARPERNSRRVRRVGHGLLDLWVIPER